MTFCLSPEHLQIFVEITGMGVEFVPGVVFLKTSTGRVHRWVWRERAQMFCLDNDATKPGEAV